MDCPRCGMTNPSDSRFCDRCGEPLAPSCPSCGSANRAGARFCSSCGSALIRDGGSDAEQPRPEPSGTGPIGRGTAAERRLVTVLFADLVGFTPFAEERDPEAVRELLQRYFDRVRSIVELHGGAVEKFIGDAVMAAWGTPIAHEDDAERAVRAGLEVIGAVRSLGAGIEARVGVMTGEAAVDPSAAGQAMLAGDLVNTSARLQSVAPPGTVLVGEATVRATGGRIAFETAGEQLLKGKSSPIAAWRALRVVADPGSEGARDLAEPPFVGREIELDLLKDLLHATTRDQRTRLVSITGMAGIGKSRLATELGRYVDGLVEGVYWHRGRSPAYGDGITFWALGEMVRQRAGLAEGDDEATTRSALTRMVERYVSEAEDREWVAPAVLALLGLDPAPPGGRDLLFAAWRILFERIAAHGTTVLLFEDLHWADAGLLDFVDHLLANVRGVPLLVITLARPELFERRPDWMVGRRNVTGVALEPLPEPVMRHLMAEWVPDLPDATVAAVLARADGVPMYAVETIRALLADGLLEQAGGTLRPVGDLSALRVPESLRSLITSRLDSLDPTDRGLVQDGAVLGQTFTSAALAVVAERPEADVRQRLGQLARRELLRLDADPRSPERGQYGFVQSLVREVAYSTLTRRDRRARHLAVARYYETLDDPELAGALAGHYAAALEVTDAGPEADALAVQARRSLRAAADRAVDLGAYPTALAYLDRAISITDPGPERAGLFERAASAAELAGRYDDGEAYARSAIDLHRSAGDRHGAASASDELARNQIGASRLVEAEATLTEALGSLHGSTGPDRAVEATLEARRARVLMRLGRDAEAVAAADRALAIAERDRLEGVVVEGLTNKGSALSGLGRYREGAALLDAAAGMARRIGAVDLELRARGNLGALLGLEEPGRSEELLREVMELARRLGSQLQYWAAWSLANQMYFAGPDWDGALALIDRCVDEDPPPIERLRLLGLRLSLMLDRGEDTAGVDGEVRVLSRTISDPDLLSGIRSLDAQRDLAGGEWARAYTGFMHEVTASTQSRIYFLLEAALPALWTADIGRARDVVAELDAEPDGSRLTESLRTFVRAGIAALEGRTEEARDGLRQVLGIEQELPWQAARWALTGLMLLPDAPEARDWASSARATFERCRARPFLDLLDRVAAHDDDRRYEPAIEHRRAAVDDG